MGLVALVFHLSLVAMVASTLDYWGITAYRIMDKPSSLQATQSHSSRQDFVLQGLYRWNSEFIARRDITVENENVPYVVKMKAHGAIEAENVVRIFMGADDGPDHWTYKVQQVVGFYERPTSMKGLQVPVGDSDERVALIADHDGMGRPHLDQYALSWVGLLKRLQKPVRYF